MLKLADLELLQIMLSCINTKSFRFLDWPGNFPDFNPMEEVFSPLCNSVRMNKS